MELGERSLKGQLGNANALGARYVAIVGGGLPHNWVSHISAGEIVRSRDLVVQFDPEKLRKASSYLPEIGALEKFFELALRGIRFFGDTARIGANALEAPPRSFGDRVRA